MSAHTMPSTTLTTTLDEPPQIGQVIEVDGVGIEVDQVTPSELEPGAWDVRGRLVMN